MLINLTKLVQQVNMDFSNMNNLMSVNSGHKRSDF